MAADSGSEPRLGARAIESDLRALVEIISRREQESHANRYCAYGLSPDRTYFVELPSGYEELAAELQAKHGDRVRFRTTDWVLLVDWRDGSFAEAREAVRDALTERGFDPDGVAPDDIRIDAGSRRKGQPPAPYFRAWVQDRGGANRDD
jgi:hypothetical protein